MGASSCRFDDTDCLLNECREDEHCQACGIDFCFTFVKGDLNGRRDVLPEDGTISARPTQMSHKLSRRKAIETTPIPRIAGFGSALHKRVEHTKIWKEYAPKGLKYYKILQARPMEDVTDPPMCELDDYFKLQIDKKVAVTRGDKLAMLKNVGLESGTKSYQPITASGPKPGKSKSGEAEEIADFSNFISPEQGVFFATGNDRGQGKNAANPKPIPYQMSTVAWWQWKHIVMLNQDPEIKEADTDFSNFKYFFRVNIENKETSAILEEALGRDNTEPKDFTPEDEGQDNAFWPLLGSPNGNGIAWFLADHKKSLKGKGIVKITAWFTGENYHMWATIK
jgi:hypothetical protein